MIYICVNIGNDKIYSNLNENMLTYLYGHQLSSMRCHLRLYPSLFFSFGVSLICVFFVFLLWSVLAFVSSIFLVSSFFLSDHFPLSVHFIFPFSSFLFRYSFSAHSTFLSLSFLSVYVFFLYFHCSNVEFDSLEFHGIFHFLHCHISI